MKTILTPLRFSPLSSPSPKPAPNFASLKSSVRRKLVGRFGAFISPALIARVIEESVEKAGETGFPLLVFPVLAEEQVRRTACFAHESHLEAAPADIVRAA